MIEQVFNIIHEVRREFASDPRNAIYEIDAVSRDGNLVLRGATSVPAAAEALRGRLAKLESSSPIRDEIVRLPDESGGQLTHAIVTATIAPMLAAPIVSEPVLSQTVLGSRLLLLREHGHWLQCRSRDGYIGWIHAGYLRRATEYDARAWENGSVGPAHFCLQGWALPTNGGKAIQLPWGARFARDGGRVHLPDGRQLDFVGESVAMDALARRFPRIGSGIVATAREWYGTPYIWGGLTRWGADCSGLVQAVFGAHGVALPRDSDQQALVGREVESTVDFKNVLPGDLLFFAEVGQRVTHVAISTGMSGIVHASLGNGGVAENDLGGVGPYESELLSQLVAIRRIIPES